MNKILIVEDDEGIRTVLRSILLDNNYLVDTVNDGIEALKKLDKAAPDLLLLDLGLPKITGESVCVEAHKKYPELPIIILTAKNQKSDVVKGLNLGAEDYIPKPFDRDELLARIKVRLRNSDQEFLEADDLKLNTKNLEVTRAGKSISLSPYEFKLLQYLLINRGRVLSREMILSRVWEYSYDVDSRVVDVYIGYLRKKIDDGYDKKLITSVRGFGYSIKE